MDGQRDAPAVSVEDRLTRSLGARNVTKWFGGARAVQDVSVDIRPGAVHVLGGVNGSGKTTLLRILSGQIAPEEGEVVVDGRPRRFRRPADALAVGIAVVTQERTLVPQLSVAENLFLGRRMLGKPYRIDWHDTSRAARDILDRLHISVDPRRLAGRLPPDQQQLVEVARALTTGAQFLLLDEPTSSLSNDEVAGLMDVLRTLCSTGVGIVFVSHRLDEMFAIADEVTVLRDGRVVATGPTSSFDEARLITEMLGRAPEALPPSAVAARHDVLLHVAGLCVESHIDRVDLAVAKGEIVGVAGLEGSGRSELLAAIYGAIPMTSGEITVDGVPYRSPSPKRSLQRMVGYVPPDRKLQGLALDRSVAENLLLSLDVSRHRLAHSSARREAAIVRDAMQRYLIKSPSTTKPVRTLSGGNQQKVVLGRILLGQPKLLLLDEPTRGVDVGAKREIYSILHEARSEGVGILLSGGEMEELLEVADRIVIMRQGRVVGEADPRRATVESLVAMAAGHIHENGASTDVGASATHAVVGNGRAALVR